MQPPLISIITVVFNGEKSLESTILSIINQSYQWKEFIIIDGGSTDNTMDIVRKYSSKIDYVQSEPDQGIYDAMNKGIMVSHGDYTCFMNCGDKFFCNSTLDSVFKLNEHREDIIYGDTILAETDFMRLIRSGEISSIKKSLPFCHQSVFVKSEILKRYNFDTNYRMASDYDLFLSLYLKKRCSFKRIDLPIAIYDNSGASASLLTVKEYSAISSKYLPYSTWSQFQKLRFVYFSFTDFLKKVLPRKLVHWLVIKKKRILNSFVY